MLGIIVVTPVSVGDSMDAIIQETKLGQVLIRGVDDVVLQSLKERAAEHGRSLEAELRQVLTDAARKSRAELIQELAKIRAMTPAGPGTLAEDLVREGRDER